MSNLFSGPKWQRNFRGLTDAIKTSQCVILLGPEIVKMGGSPIQERLRETLTDIFTDEIPHYYERDGIYLFKDKFSKGEVRSEAAQFYKDPNTFAQTDTTVFEQLVRLKTHLVVSINPDTFLSEVAYRYGIRHRFAFFQHGGEAVDEVDEPTADTPLFYNLCGSVQRDNSLVLDYDDLFSLLTSLMGNPGLPLKLKSTLELRTTQFLFVGFDFSKWYSQMLLRLLSGEKAIRSFAIDPGERTDNTRTFLVKQFGIEFVEDEAAFLGELFRQCEEQGLLRDVAGVQSEAAVAVIRHIQQGEIEKALSQAESQASDAEARNDYTLLMARFSELQEQKRKGIIDSRDYQTEWNKIVDTLLTLIQSAR